MSSARVRENKARLETLRQQRLRIRHYYGLRSTAIILTKKWSRKELRAQAVSQAPSQGDGEEEEDRPEETKHPEAFPLTLSHKPLVISIRPERLSAFRARFAPWTCEGFAGTKGDTKTRRTWRHEGFAAPRNEPGSQLTRGQLGCFHSHIRAWKALAAKKVEIGMICEDDASIWPTVATRAYFHRLEQDIKALRRPWDIIMMGHHNRLPGHQEPRRVQGSLEEAPDGVGLFAYLVSKRGLQRLLTIPHTPFRVPVDTRISQLIKTKSLRVLRTRPHLCFVMHVRSDTINLK